MSEENHLPFGEGNYLRFEFPWPKGKTPTPDERKYILEMFGDALDAHIRQESQDE